MTALSSSELKAIQSEGYEALMAAKSPMDNPYPWSDNERCKAWIAGYAMGRTDKARQMTAPLVKVGPKGYIHGWIFVGIPAAGQKVTHPEHGEGVIVDHQGSHVHVQFHGQQTRHAFEVDNSRSGLKPGLYEQPPLFGPGQEPLPEHAPEPPKAKIPEPPKAPEGPDASHLADQIASDRLDVRDLSDEELKAVDQEFARRAALMGKPGVVRGPHRRVRDEMMQRGLIDEPKAPEPPKAREPEPKPEPPKAPEDPMDAFHKASVSEKADAIESNPEKYIPHATDEELRDVSREFAYRARSLGYMGKVTPTHQKVLDELSRRYDARHFPSPEPPKVPEKPKEPEKPKAPAPRDPAKLFNALKSKRLQPADLTDDELKSVFDEITGRVGQRGQSITTLLGLRHRVREEMAKRGIEAPSAPRVQRPEPEPKPEPRAEPKPEPKVVGPNPWANTKGVGIGTSRPSMTALRQNAPAYSLADRVPEGKAKEAVQRLQAAKTVPEALATIESHWNSLGNRFEAPARLDRSLETLANVKAIGTQLIALREAHQEANFDLFIRSPSDGPAGHRIKQNSYAHVAAYRGIGGGIDQRRPQQMVVNSKWLKGTSGTSSYANDVHADFHDAYSDGTNPWTAIVTHEFGHVLDNRSNLEARNGYRTTVSDFYKEQDVTSAGQRGLHETDQLSRYAKASSAEAIGEAFSDVTLNGKNASAQNWAIVRSLMKAMDRNSGSYGGNPVPWTIGGTPEGS